MLLRKKAFLCLFILMMHTCADIKPFNVQLAFNCTILGLAIVGLVSTVNSMSSCFRYYFLKKNDVNQVPSNNVFPSKNFVIGQLLDKNLKKFIDNVLTCHVSEKLFFIFLKGSVDDVEYQINCFKLYLISKKISILNNALVNYMLPSAKLEDILCLLDKKYLKPTIEFVLIPKYQENTPLSTKIVTREGLLNAVQDQYIKKLEKFVHVDELKPLNAFLQNYNLHDIFLTSPEQCTFTIKSNADEHEKDFKEYLKGYVTSYLLAHSSVEPKIVFTNNVHLEAIKKEQNNLIANTIFFIWDSAKNESDAKYTIVYGEDFR